MVPKPRFLPFSLNGDNFRLCSLQQGRAQGQLGWAGCTARETGEPGDLRGLPGYPISTLG